MIVSAVGLFGDFGNGRPHVTAKFRDVVPSRHGPAHVLVDISSMDIQLMIDMRLSYNCDRDVRRIGEDEGHLVELAAAAPGLGKRHPIRNGWSEARPMSLGWVIDGNFHTIRHHYIQTLSDSIL